MSKFDRDSRFERDSGHSGRRRTLSGAGRKLSWDTRPLETLLSNPPEDVLASAKQVMDYLEWRAESFGEVRTLGEKIDLLNSRYMSGAKIVGKETWEKLPAAIETLTKQRAALHDERKKHENELGKNLLGAADMVLRFDAEEKEQGRGPLSRARVDALFDDLGGAEESKESSRLANSVANLLYELELAEDVPTDAHGRPDYGAVVGEVLKRAELQFLTALVVVYQSRSD